MRILILLIAAFALILFLTPSAEAGPRAAACANGSCGQSAAPAPPVFMIQPPAPVRTTATATVTYSAIMTTRFETPRRGLFPLFRGRCR